METENRSQRSDRGAGPVQAALGTCSGTAGFSADIRRYPAKSDQKRSIRAQQLNQIKVSKGEDMYEMRFYDLRVTSRWTGQNGESEG